MRRIGYCLVLLTVAVTSWQLLWLGPNLPDPVASHFGANGQADGWSSRSEFLWTQSALQVGIAGLMFACAYGSNWIPDQLQNMPNKEYWLHADRREETLARNGSMLIFIAGLTGTFLSCIFQLMYFANIQNNGQLPTNYLFGLLAVYLVILGVVVTRMLLRFRLPESETNPCDKS